MSDFYINAHNAVRRAYGPARLHQCRWCWGQATQWAYDNADPGEQRDNRNRRYSLDIARYQPLCARDHRTFDRLFRRGAEPAGYERAMRKARYRYGNEALAGMAERRIAGLERHIVGTRRKAPLVLGHVAVSRVMT